MGSNTPKRFVTSTELGRMFGIGAVAAWRSMRSGRIPCISVGRKLYADLERLDAAVIEQTRERADGAR
ncbi:MAG: hypothetical protein HYY06_01485 [Deltaproteobacteria bacterium]|nr:hypothetical protein [Deltaproteobacteria bacterium]